jgi:hypothetical protein
MLSVKSLPSKNEKNSQYVYFIRVGELSDRLFKIGTTNDPRRRMQEHARSYGKEIFPIWLSPPLTSKYTTLRVEERMIGLWRENETEWKYLRNDRFVIPQDVTKIVIKIRNEYEVFLE